MCGFKFVSQDWVGWYFTVRITDNFLECNNTCRGCTGEQFSDIGIHIVIDMMIVRRRTTIAHFIEYSSIALNPGLPLQCRTFSESCRWGELERRYVFFLFPLARVELIVAALAL